jgi:putative PIN family toxin of toxin-antitoxin system
MKVVIDTNLLWISISRKSTSHWLFDALLNNKFTLCITTDIAREYEEIISRKLNENTASFVMETLANLPNVEMVNVFYKWNLIAADPDDNKFTDCAIAGACDYLITNDKHFDVVKSVDFPAINVLNIGAFKEMLVPEIK